ncbi:hypothetical protein LXL04_018984 [Taraxacum kok-saghyz]
MTPYEKTSDFSLSLPEAAYSGARCFSRNLVTYPGKVAEVGSNRRSNLILNHRCYSETPAVVGAVVKVIWLVIEMAVFPLAGVSVAASSRRDRREVARCAAIVEDDCRKDQLDHKTNNQQQKYSGERNLTFRILNIASNRTPPIAIPTTAPVEIPDELSDDGAAGGLDETLLGGGGEGVVCPGVVGGLFLGAGGGRLDGVEPGGDGGDGDGVVGVGVEGGGEVAVGGAGEVVGGGVTGGGGEATGVTGATGVGGVGAGGGETGVVGGGGEAGVDGGGAEAAGGGEVVLVGGGVAGVVGAGEAPGGGEDIINIPYWWRCSRDTNLEKSIHKYAIFNIDPRKGNRDRVHAAETLSHTQTHEENKERRNTRILRGSDSVQILHPRAATREYLLLKIRLQCWDLLRTHIFPRTRELPQFPISPKPLFLSKNRLRNPPKPVLKQNKKLCTYAQKKSLHICKVFGKKKKSFFRKFFFATGLIFERFLAPRSRFFEKVNGLGVLGSKLKEKDLKTAPHHQLLEWPVEAPTSSNSAVANPATDSSSVSTGLDTPPDPEIH